MKCAWCGEMIFVGRNYIHSEDLYENFCSQGCALCYIVQRLKIEINNNAQETDSLS
jgi:hypothetical protein